jgi:outer membrane protein assembly factor BamA
VFGALVLAVVCLAGSEDPALLSGRSPALSSPRSPGSLDPGADTRNRGASAPRDSEVIAAIRIHGNHVTTDEEIIAIAGVTVGAPFTATTVEEVTAKLRASKKFDEVDVLKRFASIADPSQILLVIVVNEGPVRIEVPDDPTEPLRIVRRRGFRNLMFMPILDAEDGYGLTYGARLALVGTFGERSRLSFPLTWGGMKRAGAEQEWTFSRGPLTRVEVGGAVQRQTNPAFDEDDDRQRVWARAERRFGDLRLGAQTGWQHVSFADLRDDIRSAAADVTFDTRLDPIFPRNAVYGVASFERLWFESGGDIDRTRFEGRAYVGLIRQTVLVLRATRQDADASLPIYLRHLLGGWSSLRGFKAGSFTGDTVVSGSAELRIPISATISAARLGFSVFADVGKAYDKGQRFRDVRLERGYGGSVFITLMALRLSLAVGHGVGSGTRVNFGGGMTY